MDVFYLIQIGFCIHSFVSIIFLEKSQKDFALLFVHHIVTFCLVYGSYIVDFKRIGILVLLTHDISDIFLHGGKMMVYLEKENGKVVLMIMLTLSWIVSRLFIFPTRIIYSSIYDGPKYVPFDLIYPVADSFITMMEILLLMHIFWFYLIVKVIWKSLSKGKSEIVDERD